MSNSSAGLSELRSDADRLQSQLLRSSSKDEALDIAIRAAETSMRALKLAKEPSEKALWSTRVQQLLVEAERIKHSTNWRQEIRAGVSTPSLEPAKAQRSSATTNGVKSKHLAEPRSTRELSKAEQIVILKASLLNGFKFPPWSANPKPAEFELGDGEDLFLDTAELSLSEFQRQVLDDWKRPSEALPPPSWFPGDRSNLGPGMTFSRDIDLVQDAATDCSVVASLCAGVARGTKGHTKILRDRVFPYDLENDRYVMSKNGKYIVKMNFNGCYRKVVIDDRLPTSKTGRVIHVVDRHNPGLLWPALVEKAYLKVRGGYDFPGSNSGTDLWMLTGWIPEQVFLQSDELEPERLWKRTLNAFGYGDVLITMGTGRMSARAEKELGLAAEHDYAVIDMREVDGQKLFLIKNPWCEGTSWKGSKRQNYASKQGSDAPDTLDTSISLLDLDDDPEPAACSRDLLNADEQLRPGTFWMDLENVVQNFESIYLNWNPGLFSFRQDIHFGWDLSTNTAQSRGRFASLSHHPQFTVTAAEGGTIWVLLCRHLQNVPASDDARQEIDLNGYISLYAFTSGGKRALLLGERASQKSPFVDSPQTLMRLDDCQAGVPYTLTPAEQDLVATNHTFTISVFGTSPVTLAAAQTRHPHSNTLKASWTKETAGGNAHSPTYSTNPQFSIVLPQRTQLSLLLEAVNDNINVHVKLVHGKGQRVYSIRSRDIVFDSKDYRRGCCLAESASDLEPGNYTIICSTFEPQQIGDFSLRVESSQPIQLKQLPKEGAGRLRQELSNVAFTRGAGKIAAPIVPRRLVKMYAVARLRDSGSPNARGPNTGRSLVRMSIELGRGPDRRILIASGGGDYSDPTGGIRTEDIDLSPETRRNGDLWLVLDRMYPAAEEERYSVELFVDQIDAFTCGVWRAWED